MSKQAIIIGAGPAGLTAAYELLKRTDIKPVILEKSGDIGGISKTVNYKGNRIDIGGHRFFSKSDRVMQWWLNILPIQPLPESQFTITYRRHSRTVKADEPLHNQDLEHMDKVMLVRKRLSRIYFLRKFFTYPIQLSMDTLKKLGMVRTAGILISYLQSRIIPRKPEKSLEDFFINRFGNKLYRLFFKDYTEKVWGVPCAQISAEWGAQRIKGISIAKAIVHAARSLYPAKKHATDDIGQKHTETSLIEKFLYPKYGPGQLWEEVARQVQAMGGQILMHHDVMHINAGAGQVTSIEAIDKKTGKALTLTGDYFFSTMPVQELIAGMQDFVPSSVKEIAAGLQYRDFITVGVLLQKMPTPGITTDATDYKILPDTWIYIQEKDVKVGRLQIFNNWSPFMVKDPDTVWVGMEYFCNTTDDFWRLTDAEIQATAIAELEKMGLAQVEDVLDSTVLRMEKTYPAYFGTYQQFDKIRAFTDQFENLFLVGRNGMHKYNNSDHSMLTAMVAVDNICAGVTEKANIWSINTEQDYHEEKHAARTSTDTQETGKVSAHQPAPALAGAPSFSEFLWQQQRWFLYIAALAIVIQFCVFKYFYPQASFITGDSYVYLDTAYWNYSINTYPIGYSRFLRLFSVFTTSDTALVAFQYLMLQTSALFFLFSFFYFFRPGKLVRIALFVFFLFNPLFLYLANNILSDTLFIPLSLTWFTLLLWILHRPTTRLLILQAVVLFLAFTVRYNALFYPLVGALALLLSRRNLWVRLAAVAGSVALIGLFILFTSNKYHKLVGVREFTPFSGWQIANNAMYAYRYVDSAHRKPAPPGFRALDHMITSYFDTTRDPKRHPEEQIKASTVYMWDSRSPLQRYMEQQFKKDTNAGDVQKWAAMAPLYSAYGNWLIRTYPLQFAEYYLWPNAMKYYAPPVEFLESYNMGIDSVREMAKIWFGYKNSKARTRFKDFKVTTLNFYPILVGALNVIFLMSLLAFVVLDGFRKKIIPRPALLLVATLWLVNFGFSVYASPIALRFQLFPILVFISMALLLLEYIWREAFTKQKLAV